ncbi:MAG: carboxypeptidase-like regulatory domain-containing protein [Prolixibacteraceae bacterium]
MKAAFIFIFSLIIPFLISSAGKDPTKNVRGKVIDQTTETPLYGVSICVPDLDNALGTITNENGEFRLWNIPDSSQGLLVTMEGYIPEEVNIEHLSDTTKTQLVIRLRSAGVSSKHLSSHFRKHKN